MSETKSYEDVLEDNREQEKNDVTDVPVLKFAVSPNYKGKNPKSPEELAKIREERKAKKAAKVDPDDKMVNHPSHYQVGKYEAIDIIAEATKNLKGIFATDTGNALKYILRWDKKNNPRQDIKKAIYYLNHLLGKLDESEFMMKG